MRKTPLLYTKFLKEKIMSKKEIPGLKRATEKAKKTEKETVKKSSRSRAEIFKASIPEAEKEKSGKEPEETK